MTVRASRYIVVPSSACPPSLRNGFGYPNGLCPLDTDFVALCAMGEILQTAPATNPFFGIFEELLVQGERRLIWRRDGPGIGVEMRRAFSGMFGRFFARAYLQRYHGFTWFAPINRDPTYLSPLVRVKRRRGIRVDLPDWICAGPGKLAIAEAKGSHQKGNVTRGTLPGPIKTANAQITGVQVQKGAVRRNGSVNWIDRNVKGWAVMLRWGIELPPRDPFLYVLDPETRGQALTEEELSELVQITAREHVRHILEGLGYNDILTEVNADLSSQPSRAHQEVFVDIEGEKGKRFLGAVASPFGLLPLNVGEAKSLVASFPPSAALRLFFVGMDLDIVLNLRSGAGVSPRPSREAADQMRIGPDGLLIAPLDRVAPTSISI